MGLSAIALVCVVSEIASPASPNLDRPAGREAEFKRISTYFREVLAEVSGQMAAVGARSRDHSDGAPQLVATGPGVPPTLSPAERELAYARLVDHVERVTAELSGGAPAPRDDAEYRRIVRHFERVMDEPSDEEPAVVPTPPALDEEAVEPDVIPPPVPKPGVDRSGEVLAILKNARPRAPRRRPPSTGRWPPRRRSGRSRPRRHRQTAQARMTWWRR
jgi:hypothetical protein